MLHHQAPSSASPSLLFDITAWNLRQQEDCFHFSRVSKMNIRFLASHWFGVGGGHWGTGSLIQVLLSCLLTPVPDETGYQIILKAVWYTLSPIPNWMRNSPTSFIKSPFHFTTTWHAKETICSVKHQREHCFQGRYTVKKRPGQQLCKLFWPAESACVSRPRKAWNRPGQGFCNYIQSLPLHLQNVLTS